MGLCLKEKQEGRGKGGWERKQLWVLGSAEDNEAIGQEAQGSHD